MSRRPALLTQAEVARAIKGAKQAGASAVVIRTDGTILVELYPVSRENEIKPLEKRREIVL
jgi:hypothetical protein